MRLRVQFFILATAALAVSACHSRIGERPVRTSVYSEIVSPIAREAGILLRPASADAMNTIRALDFPPDAVEFYARHEPAECLEGPAGIRLWPIQDIIVENRQGVPGICVYPYRYRVFASTSGGDAYCFDLNAAAAGEAPRIVLFWVDDVGEDSREQEVHAAARPVAKNLAEFFRKFADGTLNQGYD
jgi:hypothetical protein